MPTDVSTFAQSAMQGRVDQLNSGAGNATIKLYDSGAVELLSFDLGTVGAATNACPSVATPASLPIDATGLANGTVDNAELIDGNGTVQRNYIAADIGLTTSGNPIELSTLSITTGLSVRLTTCNLRQPCA